MMVIFCLVIHSFIHPFHKFMLRTYCVLSTLGSSVSKAEGKILLYLALSNTEVICKANSRMGTVLVAVLLLWEIGDQSNSCRRRKCLIVGLLIVSEDSSQWEANRRGIGIVAENFPSWSVGSRYRGGVVSSGILKAQNPDPATHLLHGHTYAYKATPLNSSQLLTRGGRTWGGGCKSVLGLESQFLGVSFTLTTRWRHWAVEVSDTGQGNVLFLHEVGHWLVWSRLCPKLSLLHRRNCWNSIKKYEPFSPYSHQCLLQYLRPLRNCVHWTVNKNLDISTEVREKLEDLGAEIFALSYLLFVVVGGGVNNQCKNDPIILLYYKVTRSE